MRVAIVGCGQLAQMLALAGIPLGIRFSFLTPRDADTRCVDGLGTIVRQQTQNAAALWEVLGKPDVITFENEQTNVEPIKPFGEYCKIAPGLNALFHCQHRYREKLLLESLSIPNTPYRFVQSKGAVQDALSELGMPCIAKSVDQGYDGKNQWRIHSQADSEKLPESMLTQGLIIEQQIDFVKEISLVGVRTVDGQMRFYAPTENLHQNGILVQSIAPANAISHEKVEKLENNLAKIMHQLKYVGVMAMECFVTEPSKNMPDENKPGNILVNELAPRVHNSGHWTQNGAMTCQFENHIRAITNLPLGSTQSHGLSGMINVLGPCTAPRKNLSEHSTLHWYNKTIKPGRKLGHVNFVASSRQTLEAYMKNFQLQQQKQ